MSIVKQLILNADEELRYPSLSQIHYRRDRSQNEIAPSIRSPVGN